MALEPRFWPRPPAGPAAAEPRLPATARQPVAAERKEQEMPKDAQAHIITAASTEATRAFDHSLFLALGVLPGLRTEVIGVVSFVDADRPSLGLGRHAGQRPAEVSASSQSKPETINWGSCLPETTRSSPRSEARARCSASPPLRLRLFVWRSLCRICTSTASRWRRPAATEGNSTSAAPARSISPCWATPSAPVHRSHSAPVVPPIPTFTRSTWADASPLPPKICGSSRS